MPNKTPRVRGSSVATVLPRIYVRDTAPPPPKKHKPGYGANQPTLLTDEQVLEIRSLHEFDGWKRAQLFEKYGHLGITLGYLTKLLSYETRSKLIPRRK